MLNSLPSTYNNAIFTLSEMSSQSLDDMILSLSEKDERLNGRDSKSALHLENPLLTRNQMSKNTGKQIVKEDLGHYYYRKTGHTTWNCKV
jgi:hypothetical protein